MKTAARKEAAKEAYTRKQQEIASLLARLQAKLEDHSNMAADNVYWGHVADLEHIEQKLRELLYNE